MTVNEICSAVNALAPFADAMGFDNVGLLVGGGEAQVQTVLICLDVTEEVVAEAKAVGAELILSHHPVIFSPLRALFSESVPYRLAANGIAVISAHTNLDKAFPGGVNDALSRALGLRNVRGAVADGAGFLGRAGELPQEMTSAQLAVYIKKALNAPVVRFTEGARPIRTLAVMGGAGGEYFAQAAADGVDAYLTGEVKHHEAIAAKAAGFTLLEAGHYDTEIIFKSLLKSQMEAACPGVSFRTAEEKPPMAFV